MERSVAHLGHMASELMLAVPRVGDQNSVELLLNLHQIGTIANLDRLVFNVRGASDLGLKDPLRRRGKVCSSLIHFLGIEHGLEVVLGFVSSIVET